MKAYDFGSDDDFFLDRDENMASAYDRLQNMVGLKAVKEQIDEIIAEDVVEKERQRRQGSDYVTPTMHMIFAGNPGTAKTTVAKLFAQIAKEKGVLKSGAFVEYKCNGIIGNGSVTLSEAFAMAKGGVLFIDEAYSLCEYHKGSFGDEAITTIVKEMENHRDDVIVIFAGYPAEMEEFLDRNSGLRSRIAFHIEFEDYTTDELCDITRLKVSNMGMTITDAAMDKLRGIYEEARKSTDFGNGRFVRKLLEEAEMNIAERLMDLDESELKPEMLTTIDADDISKPDLKKCEKKSTIGFTV